MKKLLLVLVLGFGLFNIQAVSAQNPNNFSFSLFAADYYLDRDNQGVGTMKIDELLVAEFPDIDQNHGIERAIPLKYKDSDLDLNILSVTDEADSPRPYRTYESDGHLVLRIGDPDKYVHGTTIYKISYEATNVITFYDGHDELFWDVNGTGWLQPMTKVIAQVHIPAELSAARQNRQECFTGVFGSTAQDCTIQIRDEDGEDEILIFEASNLGPSENLSFVLGFEPDTFYENPWPARLRIAGLVLSALIPLVTITKMSRRWYRFGRDPAGRGVIVPQYVPPKGLGVLELDTVMNEKFRNQALSAALIEAAVNKVLVIHEIKKGKKKSDYMLELVKPTNQLTGHQKTLLEALFGKNADKSSRVNISDQANKLYSTANKLQKQLPKELAVSGYFRTNPRLERGKYIGGGIGLIFIGFFILFLSYWPLTVSLILSGLILLVFSGTMPAKTLKGVEIKDHLLGLKDYMSLAEAERLRFLQSPEGVRQYGDPKDEKTKLKLFETLLPYAMLFGMEKDWIKQFESLFTQPPEWFDSTRAFNSVNFNRAIAGINSSTINAFSPPASSGSSGSSGFSGGGSGGGGGGGGGGGW